MSEITIHTGTQGDETRINVDWFNENNIRQKTIIDISIQEKDKPRTLEIHVNGIRIVTMESNNSLTYKLTALRPEVVG